MTRRDPLGERRSDAPARPHYAQGVMLDAVDFLAEQTYHRGRLARALKYLFGHGTVAGLDLQVTADDEGNLDKLVVTPGLAIDPLGRLVEVPRAACIRVGKWFEQQAPDDLRNAVHPAEGGLVAEVFLSFVECERGKTPSFGHGPGERTDAFVAERITDAYELTLVLRDSLVDPPDTAAAAAGLAPDADTKDRILGGWREDTEDWTNDGPNLLPEHIVGVHDGAEVLLGRVVFGVVEETPGGRLLLAPGVPAPEHIHRHHRRFVWAPGVAAWP